MEKLEQLEKQHLEIISNNDWRDNEESKKLAEQYRDTNKIVGNYCIECNRLSTINCQYH